jgi:NAD-dependent dihydropyrimidine dehydrogenase PreA subunit
MIELLIESRCINCDICVHVCPTNVFEPRPNQPPVIARQEDCQTCYFCEVYCPVDALFVAPPATPLEPDSPLRDEAALVARGLVGSYRKDVGWGKGRKPGAQRCQSFRLTAKFQSSGALFEPPPRKYVPKNFDMSSNKSRFKE